MPNILAYFHIFISYPLIHQTYAGPLPNGALTGFTCDATVESG